MLCPTRWTVKHGSIQSIIDNYEELQLTFDRAKKIVKDTEMKSRIIFIESKMNEFGFLFGLLLSEFLFRNCDNLSKALQSDTISASEGQRIANITTEALFPLEMNLLSRYVLRMWKPLIMLQTA